MGCVGKFFLMLIMLIAIFCIVVYFYGDARGLDFVEVLFQWFPKFGEKFGTQYHLWKSIKGLSVLGGF